MLLAPSLPRNKGDVRRRFRLQKPTPLKRGTMRWAFVTSPRPSATDAPLPQERVETVRTNLIFAPTLFLPLASSVPPFLGGREGGNGLGKGARGIGQNGRSSRSIMSSDVLPAPLRAPT